MGSGEISRPSPPTPVTLLLGETRPTVPGEEVVAQRLPPLPPPAASPSTLLPGPSQLATGLSCTPLPLPLLPLPAGEVGERGETTTGGGAVSPCWSRAPGWSRPIRCWSKLLKPCATSTWRSSSPKVSSSKDARRLCGREPGALSEPYPYSLCTPGSHCPHAYWIQGYRIPEGERVRRICDEVWRIILTCTSDSPVRGNSSTTAAAAAAAPAPPS